jgi:hypothetical protein
MLTEKHSKQLKYAKMDGSNKTFENLSGLKILAFGK